MPRPIEKPKNLADLVKEERKSAAEHGMVPRRMISKAPNFRVGGSQPVLYSQGSTVVPSRETMKRNDFDFEPARPLNINPLVARKTFADSAASLRTLIAHGEGPQGAVRVAPAQLLEKLAVAASVAEDQKTFEKLRDDTLDAVLGKGTSARVADAIKHAIAAGSQGGTTK